MVVFEVSGPSRMFRTLRANSWEEVVSELEDMANCGVVTVKKVVYRTISTEERKFDTDWKNYGPKGWVKSENSRSNS